MTPSEAVQAVVILVAGGWLLTLTIAVGYLLWLSRDD